MAQPKFANHVAVRASEIQKAIQCPICLGIIRSTRTVMECQHRFCRECIDKSMRLGNNECPVCRTHCLSRQSLRDDPKFDALIAGLRAALYPGPDLDKYDKEEMMRLGDENRRNKQIRASLAETNKRQSEEVARRRTTAEAAAAAVVRKAHRKFRNVRHRSRGPAQQTRGASSNNGGNNNHPTGYGGPRSPQGEKEVPQMNPASQMPTPSNAAVPEDQGAIKEREVIKEVSEELLLAKKKVEEQELEITTLRQKVSAQDKHISFVPQMNPSSQMPTPSNAAVPEDQGAIKEREVIKEVSEELLLAKKKVEEQELEITTLRQKVSAQDKHISFVPQMNPSSQMPTPSNAAVPEDQGAIKEREVIKEVSEELLLAKKKVEEQELEITTLRQKVAAQDKYISFVQDKISRLAHSYEEEQSLHQKCQLLAETKMEEQKSVITTLRQIVAAHVEYHSLLKDRISRLADSNEKVRSLQQKCQLLAETKMEEQKSVITTLRQIVAAHVEYHSLLKDRISRLADSNEKVRSLQQK